MSVDPAIIIRLLEVVDEVVRGFHKQREHMESLYDELCRRDDTIRELRALRESREA